MKKLTGIQTRAELNGNVLYRWHCAACNRIGVWLVNLNDVERNAALHERSQHAERSAA